MVVKGRISGIARGYRMQTGNFQSDRAAESISASALLALAATGSELTYTLVPAGSATRIGIDRDLDGFFDRDEIDAGSDPADSQSVPTPACRADIAPAGGDRVVNGSDLASLLGSWAASGAGDINADGIVDGADLTLMLSAWGNCP